MRSRIYHQFLVDYLVAFVLSVFAALIAVALLSFASDLIARTLVKNQYPASALMRDDYEKIDADAVVANGGGVQVVDGTYRVVVSQGFDTLGTKQFTAAEFTDFLTHSKGVGLPCHYDIAYNPNGDFWLIVAFPTSVRIDFAVVFNREAASKDMKNVSTVLLSALLFYLLLLGAFAFVYARLSSARITTPLKKLSKGVARLREGDYAAQIDLGLKNEFAQLEDTINDMAERIGKETALRKRSEEERKKLILDVSHDLKNPMASIVGYAELCLRRVQEEDSEVRRYLQSIVKNSHRANRLLNELFELSRLENPGFVLNLHRIDVCEFLRQTCGEFLPALEHAGFGYEFAFPDEPVHAMVDAGQLSRALHNLADNAVRYNPKGTVISVSLFAEEDRVKILFADNGVGISPELAQDVFKPFVRADESRNSQTGGTGLGLAIAQRIVRAHGGELGLQSDGGSGCTFSIDLPRI